MTRNPDATVDEASFTVRRSIHIAAPVGRVWRAVTEPEYISRWFGRVELAGSEGTISWPDRDPIPLGVISIVPGRSVSYRWNNDDALGASPLQFDAATATTFTFTLESVSGGTRLTVIETGFEATSDPAANMQSHRLGWTSELDELVALVEAAS